MIDWDTFREMCRYREKNICKCHDVDVQSCSITNRGAKEKCIFWKSLRKVLNYGKSKRNKGKRRKHYKEQTID
jgi:hypothetical protein